MSDSVSIRALVALGMTPIEASVYEYLLAHPASTGYQASRGIGKPTANTYKALASLEDRGAVVAGDGRRRLYRAVPSAELLEGIERRFQEHRRAAAAGLSELEVERRDDGLYRLTTVDQVLGRIRTMLSGCRQGALLDLGAAAARALADPLHAAADGGADVRVRLDGDAGLDLDGVAVVRGEADEGYCSATAVIDAREVLIATLDREGTAVRHAVWSTHPDLARVVAHSLVADMLFSALGRGLEDGLSIDELEETFEAYAALRGG